VGFSLPATSPPPRCALTAPFHLCLSPEAGPQTRSSAFGDPGAIGRVFSVALSLGLPPVAVSHHRALSCSDFPPAALATGDRPTDPWDLRLPIDN